MYSTSISGLNYFAWPSFYSLSSVTSVIYDEAYLKEINEQLDEANRLNKKHKNYRKNLKEYKSPFTTIEEGSQADELGCTHHKSVVLKTPKAPKKPALKISLSFSSKDQCNLIEKFEKVAAAEDVNNTEITSPAINPEQNYSELEILTQELMQEGWPELDAYEYAREIINSEIKTVECIGANTI